MFQPSLSVLTVADVFSQPSRKTQKTNRLILVWLRSGEQHKHYMETVMFLYKNRVRQAQKQKQQKWSNYWINCLLRVLEGVQFLKMKERSVSASCLLYLPWFQGKTWPQIFEHATSNIDKAQMLCTSYICFRLQWHPDSVCNCSPNK